MGGAVHVKGNIKSLEPKSDNTVAEWNIYADPKAAATVFASGIPITLVPLDATNQVPMTKEFYDTLSTSSQIDLKLIYLILKDMVDELGLDTFLKEFYLWDPLAAIIMADSNRATIEIIPISIDLKTAHTKDMNNINYDRSMIHVATHIPHANKILRHLIDQIKHDAH